MKPFSSFHLDFHRLPPPGVPVPAGDQMTGSLGSTAQVQGPAWPSYLFWSSGCTWNTRPSRPSSAAPSQQKVRRVAPPHSSPPFSGLKCLVGREQCEAQRGREGGSAPSSPWRHHCAWTWPWGHPVCTGLPAGRLPTGRNYERSSEEDWVRFNLIVYRYLSVINALRLQGRRLHDSIGNAFLCLLKSWDSVLMNRRRPQNHRLDSEDASWLYPVHSQQLVTSLTQANASILALTQSLVCTSPAPCLTNRTLSFPGRDTADVTALLPVNSDYLYVFIIDY